MVLSFLFLFLFFGKHGNMSVNTSQKKTLQEPLNIKLGVQVVWRLGYNI
jgi:hypothetical protein